MYPGLFSGERFRPSRQALALTWLYNIDVGISHLRCYGRKTPSPDHHHERFDGAGYPDGLKGDRIPLGARIVTVVDAYDAMTSDRPYARHSRSPKPRRSSATALAPNGTLTLWRPSSRRCPQRRRDSQYCPVLRHWRQILEPAIPQRSWIAAPFA